MASGWRRWAVVLAVCGVVVVVVARRSGLRELGRRAKSRTAPAAGATPISSQAEVATAGEVGAGIGDLAFTDVSGRPISAEQLRGKVLLVDFWATWCAPCKTEMPGYQDLQDRYGSRGLVVIGLALDGDAGAVKPFAKSLGIRYTLALATPELQDKFGGILGLPTTILVDRRGVIRKKVIGFEYKEAFEKSLKEIL